MAVGIVGNDRRLQAAPQAECGLWTFVVDAGYFASFAAGRRGRATNSPPQFGHTPPSRPSAHAAQNVHSKEQILALSASGGRSASQHSQDGRS
jgi:hypothetical protein